MEEHLTLQHSACRAVLCLSHYFMMNVHGQMAQNYVTGYFITITMAETDQFTIKIVTYNLYGLNRSAQCKSGVSTWSDNFITKYLQKQKQFSQSKCCVIFNIILVR